LNDVLLLLVIVLVNHRDHNSINVGFAVSDIRCNRTAP